MADAVEHALYQYELYFGGLGGQTPPYPISYEGLRRAARDVLDDAAYGYVAGGASEERTMAANREAFDRWRIVPRMMVDVAARDCRTTVLGTELPAPLLLAPVGVQSIIHDEAEVATAKGAAGSGVPIVLSTAASSTMEDVAEAMGEVPRWYQLYWPDDRDLAASFVRRAEAAGYTAIVVTLDTKLLAWRPRDLETAYLPFLHGEGIANYLSDDHFRSTLDQSPEDDPQAAVLKWAQIFSDKKVTWDDIAWLREQTSLPVVLKGVQHADDARSAQDHGVDGIVVSNHGGRQVDGAVGALEMLPEVRGAVGDDLAVLFDSGIRTGADVYKAVCLGADAVLLGRPYCWGLALGGAEGVRHVVRTIMAEFDLTMALTGVTAVDQLGPERLLDTR
ncbi:MAG: lactate 2-monooxygenase [Actinobacteria bacterium]|nr:lactate 2-monooxygenase [Actinomycetota bacterium]